MSSKPNAMPPKKKKGNMAALKRVIKKLFEFYPVLAPLTVLCILFSSIVSAMPSLFMQS